MRFLLGLVLGLALGAAAGLIVAPQSGRETRRVLRQRMARGADEGRDDNTP